MFRFRPSPPVDLMGERVLAYWIEQKQPIAFPVIDLDAKGGILQSQIFWEIGEEISLEIWFPEEVRHRIRVRVVDTVSTLPFGMRVVFIELSPGAKKALGRYLARRGART